MDFTCYDMSDIQEAIRRHRDRMAQLLDDVDALRRSAAELRISGLNGRAAAILDRAPTASILATSPWATWRPTSRIPR